MAILLHHEHETILLADMLLDNLRVVATASCCGVWGGKMGWKRTVVRYTIKLLYIGGFSKRHPELLGGVNKFGQKHIKVWAWEGYSLKS